MEIVYLLGLIIGVASPFVALSLWARCRFYKQERDYYRDQLIKQSQAYHRLSKQYDDLWSSTVKSLLKKATVKPISFKNENSK